MKKTLNIRPETLYCLLANYAQEVKGFVLVENKIISSDTEDGGAEHEYVVQEIATKEFYAGSYSDWDMDNTCYDEDNDSIDGDFDLDVVLEQVFPKQVTITIYE